MFPKYSTEKPRGSEALGWWTYALLNIGLLLRAVAEPIQSTQANSTSGWMLVLSAVLQFLSGTLFVVNSWGRVKENSALGDSGRHWFTDETLRAELTQLGNLARFQGGKN